MDGVSLIKYDNRSLMSKEYRYQYKHNLIAWCEFNFPNDVEFIMLDEDVAFSKSYLNKIKNYNDKK